MGKSRYNVCVELLRRLQASGEKITFEMLEQAVIKEIGSDQKRTVIPTLQLMYKMDLITEGADGLIINALPSA